MATRWKRSSTLRPKHRRSGRPAVQPIRCDSIPLAANQHAMAQDLRQSRPQFRWTDGIFLHRPSRGHITPIRASQPCGHLGLKAGQNSGRWGRRAARGVSSSEAPRADGSLWPQWVCQEALPMQIVHSDDRTGSAETRAMDMNRMFHRMLQVWAMDVLSLRQRGLDRPSMRDGRGRSEPANRAQRKAA